MDYFELNKDEIKFNSNFEINGIQKTAGITKAIKTITDDYVILDYDYTVEIDATSNTILLELPDVILNNNGREFVIDIYNVDNNIIIIAFKETKIEVDSIAFVSGNIWRYQLEGSPDLSGVSTGDFIKATNSTNTENDGTFIVTSVSDITKHIEVTNVNGIAEISPSPAQAQLLAQKDISFTLNDMTLYKCYFNRGLYKTKTL